MIAFLATPFGRTVAIALAAVVLAGGAAWWLYSKGGEAERNANAGRVLEETEESRKLRERNDENARSLDDRRALDCLRKPAGCR